MKTFNFISGIVMAVALSACGSTSTRDQSPTVSGSSGSGSTGGTSTGLGTSTGGNIYNLPAASQQRVQIGGNGSTNPSVTWNVMTSHTLKVKVKPLPAPNLLISGYTNWVFPYGCLSVSVTVNGMTRGTQFLRVEGVTQGANSPCANAPTSQVLDFTDVISGTGPTQVLFNNAQYDNCRQISPLNYGCSMSQVWQNHQAAFDATVQVDGTWMDP